MALGGSTCKIFFKIKIWMLICDVLNLHVNDYMQFYPVYVYNLRKN